MDQGYLILRSQDRNKLVNVSPADVYFNSTISYISNAGVKKIEAESFQMFYDVPNINERNNVLLIDDGATSYPVTVPERTYNYPSLAAEVAVQLNLLGIGAFTCIWDIATDSFVITCPVPMTIQKYPAQKRDLGSVMGFGYNLPLNVSLIGGSADLNYTRDVYVISNELHRRKKIDDQSTNNFFDNVLMVVPILIYEQFPRSNRVAPPGKEYLLYPKNVFYEPNVPKQINFDSSSAVSNIDVRLLDDQGEVLYIPNTNKETLRWRLNLLITK